MPSKESLLTLEAKMQRFVDMEDFYKLKNALDLRLDAAELFQKTCVLKEDL
jgi:hypothetical protein